MKFVLGSAFAVSMVSAYSSLLDDCHTFAALFDGTCGGVLSNAEDNYQMLAEDWSVSASGDSITCDAQTSESEYMICPNSDASADQCTVTRKNCVTCYRDDATDIVYIQVQSNGMPDHCYGSKQGLAEGEFAAYSPATFQMDWKAKWNLDVLAADWVYGLTDVDSTALLTDIVCGIDTTSPGNIPEDRGYETSVRFTDSEALDGVVGVMLDNSFIYRAVDTVTTDSGVEANGYDGYARDDDYPARTPQDITDLCGHQIVGENILAYRGLAACMKEGSEFRSTTTAPQMCKEDDTCKDEYELATFGKDQAFSTPVNEEPMGIARDGHIIVGPYNEDGELYGCDDVDVCNGTFLSDSSYAYVLTTKFPYAVGCWGGRSWHITQPVEASCSVHACQLGALQGLMATGTLLAATLAALSI